MNELVFPSHLKSCLIHRVALLDNGICFKCSDVNKCTSVIPVLARLCIVCKLQLLEHQQHCFECFNCTKCDRVSRLAGLCKWCEEVFNARSLRFIFKTEPKFIARFLIDPNHEFVLLKDHWCDNVIGSIILSYLGISKRPIAS